MSKLRVLGWLAVAVVLTAGCADSASVASVEESGTDSAGTLDSSGTIDGGGGGDDVTDGGGGADSGKVECETKYDCKDMKGQTPCRVPACDAGKCTLADHPDDTPCSDTTVPTTECQQTLCNDKGECIAKPRPKTAACDDQNLTASECSLKRCDGAGKCALIDVPDGQGCNGSIACGNVCDQGKCSAQNSADYDDSNPCTQDYCAQGQEVKHDPIDDLTVQCEDGDKCTSGERCKKGKCEGVVETCNDGFACTTDDCDKDKGCVHTVDNAKCTDDGDPCTELGCDLAAGCTATKINHGAACDDAEKCTSGDKCDTEGTCIGGESSCVCESDIDCDQTNLCQPLRCEAKKCVVDQAKVVKCDGSADNACGANQCDAATGKCAVVAKNEGKDCDDNSVCTAKSACDKGLCTGDVTTECDDKNACTQDSCDALKGCVAIPGGAECDDASPCTSNDNCVNGACVGEDKPCDDGVPCTFDGCDAKTGDCTHAGKDGSCEDGNPCTTNTCDAAKGCVFPADNAGKCDDGNICTTSKCEGGTCQLDTYDKTKPGCGCTKAADCDDKNPCTADKCDAGDCKFDAAAQDTKACDDGNKCNVADSGKCKSGSCAAGTPKDCTKGATVCQTAYCDNKTGNCVTQNKVDGTACQDGSGCTSNDKCSEGKCIAGKDVDCPDKSACVASQCKSTAADKYECVAQNKPNDLGCDDGKYCTEGEVCDGAGVCKGGKDRDCSGSGDACNSGSCDDTKKACVKLPKALGTACDDGAYCTIKDVCDAVGVCKGGGARDCPDDAAKCRVGSCSEAGNACLLVASKDGSVCNDGNACTQTDLCAKGNCIGSSPKSCAGDGKCLDGTCNTANGQCGTKPKTDGTVCNDGNECTASDACAAGSCTGKFSCACAAATQAKDCNDNNACTKDTCVASGTKLVCSNAITAGSDCNDGNSCTDADKCSSKGTCAGTAKVCDDKNGCTNDYCKSGTCVYDANTNACTDNNACTVGDACANKACKPGALKNCADSTKCSTDACDAATGSCKYTAAYAGDACEKSSSVCVGTACSCKIYYQYNGTTSSTNFYYGYDVVPSSYGSSIGVGYYLNGSYHYGYLQKRDAHGTILRNTYLRGGTTTKALHAATSYGTSVYAAVGTYHNGTYSDGWFVSYNDNATVLKGQDVLVSTGAKNDVLHDVTYDPTYKQFWAVGESYLYGNQRGWIVRIDPAKSNGIGAQYFYGSSTGYTIFRGVGYYGGAILPVGYTSAGTLGGYDGVVTRYVVNATSAAYNTYKYYGGTGTDVLNDISVYNGYVYIGGRTTSGSAGNYDGWLLRINGSSLAQYYETKYGGTGYDEYTRLAPWGYGVAAVGRIYNQYAKGSFDYALQVDYFGANAARTKHYIFGSNSYTDYGNGIASTGSAGGNTHAIAGFSNYSSRGIAAQVNDSGASSCLIIPPIKL